MFKHNHLKEAVQVHVRWTITNSSLPNTTLTLLLTMSNEETGHLAVAILTCYHKRSVPPFFLSSCICTCCEWNAKMIQHINFLSLPMGMEWTVGFQQSTICTVYTYTTTYNHHHTVQVAWAHVECLYQWLQIPFPWETADGPDGPLCITARETWAYFGRPQ